MENEQEDHKAQQPLGTQRIGDARHIRVPSIPNTPTGEAAGDQPPIAITCFESTDGQPLTKRFTVDPVGKIKKISQTQLYRGIAHRTEVPSVGADRKLTPS